MSFMPEGVGLIPAVAICFMSFKNAEGICEGTMVWKCVLHPRAQKNNAERIKCHVSYVIKFQTISGVLLFCILGEVLGGFF